MVESKPEDWLAMLRDLVLYKLLIDAKTKGQE